MHNGFEEVAPSCSYFYKGLRPSHPRLRFVSIDCDDLPLILHQGITPDTSPGCADFDTRSWIGVFYEIVGVCYEFVGVCEQRKCLLN